MKRYYYLFLYLSTFCIAVNTYAEEPNQPAWKKIVIDSNVLSEKRTINVYVPEDYQKSNVKYPVMYILDGSKKNMNKAIEKFKQLKKEKSVPEIIIVGIPSKGGFRNRKYEMTPENPEEMNTGGAPNFLKFIKNEVIRKIETEYRTKPERTIIGWSFGGVFAMYSLMVEPELFDNFIFISYCPYHRERLIIPDFKKELKHFLNEHKSLSKKIYLSYATEYLPEWEQANEDIAKILKDSNVKGVKWTLEHMPEKNHSSVIPVAMLNGMKFVFSGECPIVDPDAQVKLLASGFGFTEGPAADKDGNIYFTDIPNNRIHKWSIDGEISTFIEDTNRANGLFFDKKGNLLACQGGAGKIISIDKDKKVTVLASEYDGGRFNSTNDLWIDPNGGVYFTDPGRKSKRDDQYVYYLAPDRKKTIRVTENMVRPNGIIGTKDGKTLYISNYGENNKTWVFKINPDGTLSDKKLFAEQGSDGMTIDNRGNVYLTFKKVSVYSSSGEKVTDIEIPEKPTNVTFGGTNNSTLFITARTSLYSVETNAKGQ